MNQETFQEQVVENLQSIAASLKVIANAQASPSSGGRGSGGSGGNSGSRQETPPDSTTPRGKWQDVTIPFGKHKGKTLGQIPSGYLSWLCDKWAEGSIKEADLHDAVGEYYKLKNPSGGAPAPRQQSRPDQRQPKQESLDEDDIPF